MLIDTRVSWSVLILAVLCLIFPFLADLQFPLLEGAVVRGVENIQALLLLIFAVFSYFYMQPMRLPEGKSIFGSEINESAITNFFFCPPDNKSALTSLMRSSSNFEISEFIFSSL